jgi:hypothetical protein
MSTALISLASVDRERETAHASSRPSADFIAHLIATSAQAPQTRARRRAEPELAVAAYGALGQWPTPAGLVLSRAL